MCGCGFGDIFANRFRKHLLECHELRMTISEVAEQFFWHDLPPFQQVWKCVRQVGLKGVCQYRSPYKSIVNRFHACRSDMRVTPLPDKDAFFKLIRRDERPIYGWPAEAVEINTREPQRSFTFYNKSADMKAMDNQLQREEAPRPLPLPRPRPRFLLRLLRCGAGSSEGMRRVASSLCIWLSSAFISADLL